MKRTIPALLAAGLLLGLLGGCGAKPAAAPVVLSEEYTTPAPAPTPAPTPEPAELTEYALGNGTVLRLPEGYTVDVMEGGSFFLAGSTSIVSGAWYDGDYFAYVDEDYPASAEDAAALLLPPGREVVSQSPDGDRWVAEYIEEGQTTRWTTYAVFLRFEALCWKVEFLCPEELYEELRPQFVQWSGQMELAESLDGELRYTMTSVSGLFTLELPYSYVVIDEHTTAAELAAYGMAEEDAAAFLDEVRARSGGADVVYRSDFGAMLTVTVDRDAGLTQAEMPELEDELAADPALEDAVYEGMVMVEDDPNLFYLMRVRHDGYDELGFTTAHDGTGASITFSFVGFSDDEARDILATLTMLETSG